MRKSLILQPAEPCGSLYRTGWAGARLELDPYRFLPLPRNPLDQILAFENGALYESTSERCTARDSLDAKLVSAREAAAAINLLMYLLTHPKVRQSMGVPFVYVGKLVRFNLDDVMAWARRCASEVDDQGLDAAQNVLAGSGTHVETVAKLPAQV